MRWMDRWISKMTIIRNQKWNPYWWSGTMKLVWGLTISYPILSMSIDDFTCSFCNQTNCFIFLFLEAEFMFRRDKTHTLSSFIDHSSRHGDNIIEEDNDNDYYDDGYYNYGEADPNAQGQFISLTEQYWTPRL